MLAEKPCWHMIGEAKGLARPMNSSIESTPQFETATKAAPITTVEHTTNIEDIIKRRILNEDWDNVVPRELPDFFLEQEAWRNARGQSRKVQAWTW
jgi:U3 small nucleolar ribonucleoprotein component